MNAFERLELPEGHSEMVKSLVVQHFRSKQSGFSRDEQTDLIQGKGMQLVSTSAQTYNHHKNTLTNTIAL